MGGTCAKIYNSPKPNPGGQNKYLLTIGENFVGENFCTSGTASNTRPDYCENISDNLTTLGTEFRNDRTSGRDTGTCPYLNFQEIPFRSVENSGCCNGNCVISGGRKVACTRQKYIGNDVTCCFKDASCVADSQEQELRSFETPEKKRTCDPIYRDLNTNVCRNTIKNYCIGELLFPTQTSWLDIWLEESFVELNSHLITENESDIIPRKSDWGKQYIVTPDFKERFFKYPERSKQPCLRAIARAISNRNVCTWEELENTPVLSTLINPEGFNWSRDVIEKIIDKYIEEYGNFITGINETGTSARSSSFENTIWRICHKIPSLCKPKLNELCSGVTEETILNNPTTLRWCGCYMKNEEYNKYENQYLISRECTPFCNRPGNIPVVDDDNFEKICTQNICILSDNVINLVNSQSEGGVNFNQVCTTCGATNIKKDLRRDEYLLGSNEFIGIRPAKLNGGYGSGYPEGNNIAVVLDVIEDDIDTSVSYPVSNMNQCYLSIGGDDNKVLRCTTFLFTREDEILNIYDKSNNFTIVRYADGSAIKNIDTTAVAPVWTRDQAIGNQTDEKITDIIFGRVDYGIDSSSCRCIADGSTLNIINTKFKSLNVNINCGNSECYDEEGRTVVCGSDSLENASSYETTNQIIKKIAKEQTEKKYKDISYIMLGALALFIGILIASYFLKRKK
jgi:hypothetical protein